MRVANTTPGTAPITGRCYCGATSVSCFGHPQIVAYCHCSHCRRWTGAPVAAFAAFAPDDVRPTPGWPAAVSVTEGVERWCCPDCGSPVAARFDDLPGQIYVPLGLLDQAGELPPQMHSHADACLPWLHITDDAPRTAHSARHILQGTATRRGSPHDPDR